MKSQNDLVYATVAAKKHTVAVFNTCSSHSESP